ncbi:uncharacterized protein LOC129793334 [Lutzomyia longipalpis]|uniref:uncharacterized protein LOC129793334 n=1 Tax=Lutzomyia longipalpis TaxID=7200 RepID=UPI0024843745|nr:uncharacterized protein LOC129793334 [Lutzomyia longipalpis]
MTGGNRTPWPSGALRRQKSCGDGFLLTTTVRGRAERYTHTLQRQFSVDQDMRHCQSTIKDDKVNPETNFRTHAKKRQTPTNGEGVSKSEHQAPNSDLSERLKKALNRRDNRINLNIVLTQVPNIPEPEAINVSDSESQSNELPQAPVDSDTTKDAQDVLPGETKSALKSNAGKLVPPTTRGHRPPLVRAMSAPIRTTGDASQNRRKNLRRRKFGRDREENLIISSRKNLERQNAVASDTSPIQTANACDRKGPSVAAGTARSSIGCDIVTLVSLLSSGGSDSEREDNGQPSSVRQEKSATVRPPSLKKTGKSVSFQDNETVPFTSPPKDFSTMFRRGSVAPLAARIRSNRPPTAPPGSIFITDYEKGCSEESMSFKKQPVNTARSNFVKSKIEDKCATIEADDQSPENLKTAKERECWKLFQKMTNRGISVSYDTILRGMLTPTELRMIQKKQELENAKRNSIEEPTTQAKGTSSAGTSFGGPLAISAQNRDKVKNVVKQ